MVPHGTGVLPPPHLATVLKNVECLGFTFSEPLIARLRTLSVGELFQFYTEVIPALRAMVGADVAYRPMYPNFPAQVMELDRVELYINAILHYLTHARPVDEGDVRPPLLDRVDLNVIELCEQQDIRQICARLLAAKTALSAADRADVESLIAAYGDDLAGLIPAAIPVKEHVALLATCLLRFTTVADTMLAAHIKTATDVLRLAVALSDGDASLAANTKFRGFTRAERRLLLGLLEGCANITEDMLRHKGAWIRLGERLHPGEYQRRFPRSYAAFDILRNDRPFETFNRRVEQALRDRDVLAATDLLSGRAGELARRLDHLLRLGDQWRPVTDTFARTAPKIATPVLLQVLAHFIHRDRPRELRTFFPKGNVARVQAIENRLPQLDEGARAAVVAICRRTLVERFSALPSLGRVFVDGRLKDYVVPYSQRSASKALRTLARGSRLPLPPGSTVRFFLWWKEGLVNGAPTGRVDIDLSAVMYDADWRYVEHISYTNLRSSRYGAAHSGDIVTAPNGACEFIDLDIESVVRYGGRYVMMSLNSFTEQPFCNLPECYAGWMARQAPSSGEIFDPRTVQDKIDVAADTRICIPLILDLVERTVIWTDLALRSRPRWRNNVESNQTGMRIVGKAMTTLAKPDLYTLFELHALARGTLVDTTDQADTIFAPDTGVTPFDSDRIIADYM
jgi:hypothetical protein